MAFSLPPKKIAVGIDLGTTYSCVGVFQNGRVEIIANDQGNRITPSYVAFTETERLIGEGAKAQASTNPSHTIYDIKRLIGRKFEDKIVQEDVRTWPFKVIDADGSPNVQVLYKNQEKTFSPEQISSMILTKMKEIADSHLGVGIVDAVITVPAYFTDGQRQATKDAGEIAGLNVLKIINEPTAAAIAYGIDKKVREHKNVLVFDLGGGTFDVAIMAISQGKFEVKAVGGDTHLGGSDFDSKLVQHFLTVIERKHKVDLSSNHRALGRLRSHCEKAKRGLSTSLKASIDIACLFEGIDFQASITRNRFEELCLPLFEKTIEHVERTLISAELTREQVTDIVLVGGSTRIPKIQQMLEKFFGGRKLTRSINPDEAVAYGAAVEAAILSGESSIEEHSFEDVIPLSLSVKNPDGTVSVGLKRNTKIPVSHTLSRTTVSDFQKSVRFRIYEGERSQAKDNTLLGTFDLDNIEYARKGVPKFALTFTVDENGILTTSAIDKKTRDSNGIIITENKGRLNRTSIDRMIAEERTMNEEDETKRHRIQMQNMLESYCLQQKLNLSTVLGTRDSEKSQTILEACDHALEWLEQNPEASMEDCQRKLRVVKNTCEENSLYLPN